MDLDQNPFIYDQPLEPDELIDRESDIAELLYTAHNRTNSRLAAPRRYGKTSLLKKALIEAAERDWNTVYVDFYGVASVFELTTIIKEAYESNLQGKMQRRYQSILKTLQPKLQMGPAIFEPQITSDGYDLLRELLNLPVRLYEKYKKRTLIVFDEFQEVLQAHNKMDRWIRRYIQHHGDAVSYVFAGSQPGLMLELFASRERAFYGQAHTIRIGKLNDADICEYVTTRFQATGRDVGEALQPLLDLVQGHPQRAMLAAHHLWRHTAPNSSVDANTWAATLNDVFTDLKEPFEITWSSRNDLEKHLLINLATRQKENLAKLISDPTQIKTTSMDTACNQLVAVGDIIKRDESYEFVDPLFEIWIRGGRRFPATN